MSVLPCARPRGYLRASRARSLDRGHSCPRMMLEPTRATAPTPRRPRAFLDGRVRRDVGVAPGSQRASVGRAREDGVYVRARRSAMRLARRLRRLRARRRSMARGCLRGERRAVRRRTMHRRARRRWRRPRRLGDAFGRVAEICGLSDHHGRACAIRGRRHLSAPCAVRRPASAWTLSPKRAPRPPRPHTLRRARDGNAAAAARRRQTGAPPHPPPPLFYSWACARRPAPPLASWPQARRRRALCHAVPRERCDAPVA